MEKGAKLQLDSNRQYVIGTAGHIDHGKTALVRVLTGVDTDRLPEEKARGITIDLGFAHLSENITIIDVPGHERLIKNMVAGVSTIDLVLLVVAADDGIMPQTREHLDIVRLLQIQRGVVAITKIDLVEPEWLELVAEDVRSLLQDTPFPRAPVVYTSAATGEGIEQLRSVLLAELAAVPPREDAEVFRLPVDRVFTAHGFGTVVTGTVLSGSLKTGQQVEVQPTGRLTRVRGLQTHAKEVHRVRVGYRAAINLADLTVEQIHRGDVLTEPGRFEPAGLFNARLWLLPNAPRPLKSNQRIRLHLHTREVFGRIILPEQKVLSPGQNALVQIRLEQPVHAAFQDRFIIRQYSPQVTLGGGVVLQVNPPRFRKRHLALFRRQLERLESGDPQQRVLAAFDPISARPLGFWAIKRACHLPTADLQKLLQQMLNAGELFRFQAGRDTLYLSREQLETILERIERTLKAYHHQFPGRPGMEVKELLGPLEGLFNREAVQQAIALGLSQKRLVRDIAFLRLASFQPTMRARDAELVAFLEEKLAENPMVPPTLQELAQARGVALKALKEPLALLRRRGRLVYVSENLHYLPEGLEQVQQRLRDFFQKKETISVPEFKELIGSTRKHAIPLLEYFDRQQVTVRQGDVRLPGPRLKG